MVRKKYINPFSDNNRRSIIDVALWQLGVYNDKAMPPSPPRDFLYPNPSEPLCSNTPQVTWVNHCTFFVSIDGINMLTDPIWSDRCSPVRFLGPKRMHPPPIGLENLPKIDIIFISHNHYDHLDRKTVMYLAAKNPEITCVVPKGLSRWFRRIGVTNVVELAWWEVETIVPKKGLELQVTSVPSQHFSGRGIFDKDKSLWSGFVVDIKRLSSDGKRMYFVGDTGYNPIDFKAIGKAFGQMDLSLIPIGTYVPHKFMDPVHIDPIKATKIHMEVNSKLSVGMHWKTFRLSSEGEWQPPYDLYLALKDENIDPLTFRVLEPGQTINW